MLSPSYGQVTHALLARPPLSSSNFIPKNSIRRFSFDLHVLGTPPAFVLSQDQTLVLYLFPVAPSFPLFGWFKIRITSSNPLTIHQVLPSGFSLSCEFSPAPSNEKSLVLGNESFSFFSDREIIRTSSKDVLLIPSLTNLL